MFQQLVRLILEYFEDRNHCTLYFYIAIVEQLVTQSEQK